LGRKLTAARVKTIYQRQFEPAWDETYQPAIQATPQEAPSHSRASIVMVEKFQRGIHLLSSAELNIFLLGIYHPNIIGIQEQRMFSPVPTVHPLWNFNGVDRFSLKPLEGTIKVAERLGLDGFFPKIKMVSKSGEHLVPIPLIGDLLFAIKDDLKTNCINWSIKSQFKQFSEVKTYQFDKLNRDKTANERLLARHELERTYYEDAGIKTHFIAEDQIDKNVLSNLRQLFLYQSRNPALQPIQHAELFHHFQTAFNTGIPPYEVIRKFHLREKYTPEQSKSVLFQAIWNRKIRPDLFKPILIDRPLAPEKVDVLEAYQDFFRSNQ
jgi:hypothetical protein